MYLQELQMKGFRDPHFKRYHSLIHAHVKGMSPTNNIIAPITRFLLKWETDRKIGNSQRRFKENAFQVLHVSISHTLPGDGKWRCSNAWYIKVFSNKPSLTCKEIEHNSICTSASFQTPMHLYYSILLLTLGETSSTTHL